MFKDSLSVMLMTKRLELNAASITDTTLGVARVQSSSDHCQNARTHAWSVRLEYMNSPLISVFSFRIVGFEVKTASIAASEYEVTGSQCAVNDMHAKPQALPTPKDSE